MEKAVIKLKDVTLKNNETIHLVISRLDDDDYFILNATNDDNASVGFLSFTIKKRVCYILRIEITNMHYSHIGLGSNMIQMMEDYANSQKCEYVDGKFYPFGDLGVHAKSFYLKHNYNIMKDGYETIISKTIRNLNKSL